MQNNQADQPCVLVIGPRHRGVALALLKALGTARSYDETYLKTVPGDDKPSLSISKWTAELSFDELRHRLTELNQEAFNTGLAALNQEAFNTFITQVVLQIRRKQEINLRFFIKKSNASLFASVQDVASELNWVISLAKGSHPLVKGALFFRVTILNEDREIQEQVRDKLPSPDDCGLAWELATEQDLALWRKIDSSVELAKKPRSPLFLRSNGEAHGTLLIVSIDEASCFCEAMSSSSSE
jgi:hypothetical protein